MANLLNFLAFSGLIAAQFLAVVVTYQSRHGFPAWHDSKPQGITLVHRAL